MCAIIEYCKQNETETHSIISKSSFGITPYFLLMLICVLSVLNCHSENFRMVFGSAPNHNFTQTIFSQTLRCIEGTASANNNVNEN